MKSEPLDMAFLFDFYGDMLTPKQRDYFDCYHNQDLSLSEIAENEGITRQGARDVISRAEKSLLEYEKNLGFVARYARIQEKMEEVAQAAGEILQINEHRYLNDEIKTRAERIYAVALEIANSAKE